MQGTVNGIPKIILRVEGFLVLLAGVFTYKNFGFDWSVFFWCFFLPDISFVGYLFNSKIGAICYNLAHSYILPLILVLSNFVFNTQILLLISCIWICHIGFDRTLGFGLKYSQSFGYTHLGLLGKEKNDI